jgi:pimeloyl-ACP methyl ester carboxylesterase
MFTLRRPHNKPPWGTRRLDTPRASKGDVVVVGPEAIPEGDLSRPRRRVPRQRIVLVTAASLLAGLVLAVVVVTAPVIPPRENSLVAGVLLAFALGWVVLAVLSARFTDQPQRWAAAPAAFMGLAGGVALSGSVPVETVFNWIWPPLLFGLAIWTWLRVRRQLRSRLSRWLLYPVIAVMGLASVGAGFVTVQEATDLHAQQMPGRLVDIGGHRLHLHCVGSGSPAVILEPGLGATSSDFRWIAPAVAYDTRVCVYDRAGRGFSDGANGPQDGARIATDLRTLLDRAHVPGPYVLAGHSFGGLYILSFGAQFPDQVAGMVLLDSTAPQTNPAEPDSGSVVSRIAVLMPALGRLTAGRDLGSSWQEFLEGSASVQQASLLTNLNGKPLIVVTADTGNDSTWLPAQQRMTTLSTNSLHRVAHATTHQSLVDDEADSAAAAEAIRDVVGSVRTSRALAAK